MTLHVLEAGFRSTVQDRGRFGHLRSAIPIAGPADPLAFEAAQRLVGNTPADMAAIEIVGVPFRFTLDEPRLIAASGPDVRVRTRGGVGGWTAIFVRAGEEVTVEGSERTRFAYLAVSGGLALEAVLGSRATYLPAAIGPLPRPLAAGDKLPLGAARWGADRAGRSLLLRGDDGAVRVMRGPHAERVRGADAFMRGTTLRVSQRSDRMGVRLEGAALETGGPEILSHGVAAGAIQVPHGGDPIVLLADGQTTGGYPVIATVIGADLGAVAQALPGGSLSFYEVDRRAAVEALRALRDLLDSVA
ncbi:MAG: biotin-dependent carboxyltransferase family protein [Chloroflexi bacterium]|nr:biotin-dependent carboxyltransferase family protein [Chloroflexota bacterium]